jgi:hypothetical protein
LAKLTIEQPIGSTAVWSRGVSFPLATAAWNPVGGLTSTSFYRDQISVFGIHTFGANYPDMALDYGGVTSVESSLPSVPRAWHQRHLAVRQRQMSRFGLLCDPAAIGICLFPCRKPTRGHGTVCLFGLAPREVGNSNERRSRESISPPQVEFASGAAPHDPVVMFPENQS